MPQKGTIGHDQIHKSIKEYTLDGMTSPNFVNNGKTTVHVLHQEIPPGGQFTFDFPGIVLRGTIPITFVSEAGKKDLVNVYFCTVHYNCN